MSRAAPRSRTLPHGDGWSDNLRGWRARPVALTPGARDAWDGLAPWTGWVVGEGGRFFQFYTGRRASEFWLQRIGLSLSDDLERWDKRTGFVLEADPRYYSTSGELNALGVAPAWRDPCVFRDPGSGFWYMTISGRSSATTGAGTCSSPAGPCTTAPTGLVVMERTAACTATCRTACSATTDR